MMNESNADRSKDRGILSGTLIIAAIFAGSAIFFRLPTANPKHGWKGATLATATALESAINSIHMEYGRIPSSIGNRMNTSSPEGLRLLGILTGTDATADNALNSRAIKFLSVREGKNNKNGIIYSADGIYVEGLYDSWGNPYTVIFNTQNTQELHFTIGTKPVDLKGRRVAVFSPGPDMKSGTADDVKTW